MFAELFFLSIIGKIGTLQLAASNIAIKIYLIAIMPAFGVGSSSGSIVGYYLGRNEPKKSILAFKDGLRYSFIIMGSFGLCFLLFPLQILNLFTENLNLIKIGVPLIRFLTIFCILDAIVVILECGLEGAGDVRFTSNMTQIHIWLITIPLIYITGYLLNLGIWGPWCSWLIGLLFMLFILINRIKNEKWTNINV